MKAVKRIVIVMLVLGAVWAVSLARSPSERPAPPFAAPAPPFAAGQIERIEASADCDELQIIFDASAESHDRFGDEEPPNLEMMRTHTAIMVAADDRMETVGCY